MSNNLALTQLAANQASPEVPHNDALAALDAAITEQFDIDLTGANVNVTTAQFQKNIYFRAINASVARNVGWPMVKRGLVLFENDAANTGVVTLVMGTTTFATVAGRLYAVLLDGTANGMRVRDIGGINEPHDLHIFVPGTMVANQLLYRMKATRAFTLKAGLPGSYASATVAATASTTVTLKKNGTSIGTAVWSAAGVDAAFTFAADVAFAAADVLTVEGPASPDATLANVSFDLIGQR